MDPKNDTKNHNHTESAIDAGKAIVAATQVPQYVGGGDRPFVIVPAGFETISLQPFMPPQRHAYRPTLQTEKSFINYVNRFKLGGTTIYASTDHRFVAIMDHPAAANSKIEYGDHQALYAPAKSREWKRWSDFSGRYQTQVNFAEFIEENALDVIDPSPARMIEVAQSLEITKNAKVTSSQRLDNGEVQFSYVEDVTSTAGKRTTAEVPRKFMLNIPVFDGDMPVPVECLFKHRAGEGGAVGLRADIHRADFILKANWDAMVARVAEETSSSVHSGWPAM